MTIYILHVLTTKASATVDYTYSIRLDKGVCDAWLDAGAFDVGCRPLTSVDLAGSDVFDELLAGVV